VGAGIKLVFSSVKIGMDGVLLPLGDTAVGMTADEVAGVGAKDRENGFAAAVPV
jgi:hypothetical protein